MSGKSDRLFISTVFILLIISLTACSCSSPGAADAVSRDEKWRSDLELLRQVISSRHPSPFGIISRDEFDRVVDSLRDSIPAWNDERVITRMASIAALAGDRHTSLDPTQAGTGFRPLPVEMCYLGDDLTITAASPEYSEALGARIVSIGGTAERTARYRIQNLISSDNDVEFLVKVPLYMRYPDILLALGIISSIDSVILKIETPGGEARDVHILAGLDPSSDADGPVSMIEAFPSDEGSSDEFYTSLTLPGEGHILHIMMRRISAREDGFDRINALMDGSGDEISTGPGTLVIDLRGFSGERSDRSYILVDAVDRYRERSGSKKLYAITGRSTSRAGTLIASVLRRRSGAIIVGENTPCDLSDRFSSERHVLPWSKLEYTCARRRSPGAEALVPKPYLSPDIFTLETRHDRLAGRDSAIDTIKHILSSPAGTGAERPSLPGMALIPAGTFVMGKDDSWDRDPAHEVSIDSFFIDTHEVTNAEYYRFCIETGRPLPELWGNGKFHCGPDYAGHPVVGVTYADAAAYAGWAGKRLPTEAEWEFAARGGLQGLDFPNGSHPAPATANFRAGNPLRGTMPVGSYPPNGYGLFDMCGNVSEWVRDYYYIDYYGRSPRENPVCTRQGNLRSIRGGGFHSGMMCASVTARNGLRSYWVDFCLGFRCAKDIR